MKYRTSHVNRGFKEKINKIKLFKNKAITYKTSRVYLT